MAKQDLTPHGVALLIQSLYALPDPALFAEAVALEDDFVGWVKAHFYLDAQQEAFLEGLPATFIAFVSLRVPFAFRHRLPVRYSAPAVPAAQARGTKRIKSLDKSQQSSDTSDNEGASGEVEIVVEY